VNAKLVAPTIPELPVRHVGQWGLKELERIRLILRGGSVIEWRRLHFTTRDEVDRFLRLCLIDPSNPADEAWVREVLTGAVSYLRAAFNYRVTAAVARPREIHDLFLYASGEKDARYRRIACVVLKVMHVIQHIEGKSILHRLAVAEADLQDLLTAKVMSVFDEMAAKDFAVSEFANSLKTRESIITKLLAKRETHAAQVYDKTRFRIVTKKREDILDVLYYLTQRLFPFNFVVPGQTENSLVRIKDLIAEHPHLTKFEGDLHLDINYEDHERRGHNQFSGSGYRVLNFVVDVPLRLDAIMGAPRADEPPKNRIAFMLCEFQIMDELTALQNESGENSHERYKNRQKLRVLRRLSRGLVVPKRKRPE
jgi:uncharacterized protein (TIGR04552 family)